MLKRQFSTNIKRYLPQILSVVIKNAVLFSFGSSAGMSPILVDRLSGSKPYERIVLNREGISWIASLNRLCVPIGSLFSGALSSTCGRRRALQLASLPFCVGFLLFYFSAESWHVFLGLSMNGIAGGLCETPASSYTAEISEPALRGSLTATSTLFISAGILFSFILGTFFPWRTVALVNACVCIAGTVLITFIPETPYWLVSRGRLSEAQQSLARLRGWTTVDDVKIEFKEITENIDGKTERRREFNLKPYVELRCIKPFFLIILAFFIGNFGISPVSISSYYATILTGCVNLTCSVLCIVTLRYCGKRLLTFISLTGVSICFLITGIYAYSIKAYSMDSPLNSTPSHSWIPLLTLVLVEAFGFLFILSLPWILMGEIYHREIRDVATGVSAATGYLITFAANKTFLNLVAAVSLPGVFWFYCGLALAGLIFFYFLLPETEGKTLFDISEHYNGGAKLDNKVYRE